MQARILPEIFDSLSVCPTLSETKQLHAVLITARLSSHAPLATKLLRSYAAHDDIFSARLLFDRTTHRTVRLWNSIIRAHARRHDFSRIISLFTQMRRSGTSPDGHTFACILRSFSENSNLRCAKMVHGNLISSGLGADPIGSSAVISAYSKLGLVDDARSMFDVLPEPDLVLWNSMISGYGYKGLWQKGLALFHRMREAGERPDGYSLVGLLSCFWDRSSLLFASGIHGICLKGGYDSSPHVRSVLVSMYSRCGCLDSGYRIFRGLSRADLVTWSALIAGFSQVGRCKKALTLFKEMNSSGERPDAILVAGVLSACASVSGIAPGKEIHGHAIRHGMELDVAVSCALIDTYAKCGFAELGLRVFELMPCKNLVAYNTAISCLGSHGLGREAVRVFEEMLDKGFKPDGATFSAALLACCHSGLLDDGWRLFGRMADEFGLEVQREHYVYMVKLLAMVGQLKEAYDLIGTMPMLPDSGIWGALLWGCSVHGSLDLAKIAAQRLLEINPSKAAYRVMLSNIYAAEEKWRDVGKLRDEMMNEGLQKSPGLSWIGDCNV
ncbi:putative pentatricopeptide repeat-containing protein At1g64310 [Phoenix dactylifera]|uniref:Pentatricopeptide repeat-containing protein At1g64310 n=1 Tax=Phoenix dactylifera TaxID=42345 RepID=A0A8B7C6N3_PHODC|nr:putative pentatricopeptide repeat-containing protein At1g64310 [Phoenix dactylifera]